MIILETIIPIIAWASMAIFAIHCIKQYNGWGY